MLGERAPVAAVRPEDRYDVNFVRCALELGDPGVGLSRRRDCHFTDTPSPSLLKRLVKGEGGAAE